MGTSNSLLTGELSSLNSWFWPGFVESLMKRGIFIEADSERGISAALAVLEDKSNV